MRYKIGDTVTIRKSLSYGVYFMDGVNRNREHGFVICDEMLEFSGMKAKVIGIRAPVLWGSASYKLCIDKGSWKWTDEMMEG